MTLSPIVFWGAKGQAKVLREFLPVLGYELIACFDNNPAATAPFPDVPLVGGWSAFASWRERHPGEMSCVVAIGGDNGEDRLDIQRRLADLGLHPVTLVHPTAFVAATVTIGSGSQVLAMSAVCAEAQLGVSCIINTGASVDHESILGDGVHIGPGATICGEVRVEDFAFIAAGATVLPRIRIGRRAVVGAGALVRRNVPPESRVFGVPARDQGA